MLGFNNPVRTAPGSERGDPLRELCISEPAEHRTPHGTARHSAILYVWYACSPRIVLDCGRGFLEVYTPI